MLLLNQNMARSKVRGIRLDNSECFLLTYFVHFAEIGTAILNDSKYLEIYSGVHYISNHMHCKSDIYLVNFNKASVQPKEFYTCILIIRMPASPPTAS